MAPWSRCNVIGPSRNTCASTTAASNDAEQRRDACVGEPQRCAPEPQPQRPHGEDRDYYPAYHCSCQYILRHCGKTRNEKYREEQRDQHATGKVEFTQGGDHENDDAQRHQQHREAAIGRPESAQKWHGVLQSKVINPDQTKSNHQDTKITKADQGRARRTGGLAKLIADEVADPLPEVKP
jgi:hypothetical protein